MSAPALAVDAEDQDLSRGAGNLSAYAAPVEAPAAALGVRQTGKVKINVAAEDDDEKAPPSSGLGVRLDARTGRLMTQAAKKAAEESPWAQETATVPLGAAVLPSSLAPGARTEPAPPSVQEKPAGVPEDGNRGARVMGVLAVVAVLGYAAFQLMPKTATPPEASGAVVAPPIAPSVSAAVAPPGPVGTVEVDAGVSVAPSLADGHCDRRSRLRCRDQRLCRPGARDEVAFRGVVRGDVRHGHHHPARKGGIVARRLSAPGASRPSLTVRARARQRRRTSPSHRAERR